MEKFKRDLVQSLPTIDGAELPLLRIRRCIPGSAHSISADMH